MQWTLLAPVVMLAVLGLVQGGLWLRARDAVATAALACAEIQALSGAGEGQGRAAAVRTAERGGLASVDVRLMRQGDATIACTVTGRVSGLSLLGRSRVSATAVQPLEEP